MDWKNPKAYIPAAIVIGAAGVGSIAGYFLGHDNAIEQLSEKIIKSQTGLEVDLTPFD